MAAHVLSVARFAYAVGRVQGTTNARRALATVIRDGGFFFVVVMCRLSSLPAHFTTVVFTLSGVKISIFVAAAVVSLAKVLPNIFGGGEENDTTKTINVVVIGVTIAVTIFAMRYVGHKVDAAKPAYVYARRKSRRQKAIYAVDDEGFCIAVPRGQKAHASPPAMWAEDYLQESLYTGYSKQVDPSQRKMLHNPIVDGGTVQR
ncbi:hypothetical protein PENSPDRAFT_680641 [Peniophora sp. CONT]|nr:hypothetical protein PENSPDRAFT_680641 [Peniophora sp. CONT]